MRTLLTLICLLAGAAAAQNLPQDAERMRQAYHAGLKKIAAEHDQALAAAAEDYILDLRKLSTRLRTAKNTAGTEAVRQEASRYMKALAAEPDPFETVPELTDDDRSATDALRLVQDNYTARRAADDYARDAKVTGLANKYTAGLDALHATLAADGKAAHADAAKKEANRIRVAMQHKDFARRAFAEAALPFPLMPPPPDPAAVKERAAAPRPTASSLLPNTVHELPPAIRAFLTRPLEFDKDWPPEITKWKFDGIGNIAPDQSLFRRPGLPEELGIFPYTPTMRAYIRGTKHTATSSAEGRVITWAGKAFAWTIADSRDLACKVTFRTPHAAPNENAGPAAFVAVYSTTEKDRLIASMTVPMLTAATTMRMAKHYSYNRMNIAWDGTKRKRGFTIPDHMPMRVVIGVAALKQGEEIDATVEILPCGPLGDLF